MDKEDIHILRLMGEIERNGSFSQRELARRLNLSLGLVNRFIKRLVSKGYFKVKTMPRNRAKYLLTPKGIARKSKLTVEYLKYSVNFYREIKGLLMDRFSQMEGQGIRRVLFYGPGEVAELAFLYLQLSGIKLVGVVDNKPNADEFFGHRIIGMEGLKKLDWDGVLITRLEDADKLIQSLKDAGVPWKKIFTL